MDNWTRVSLLAYLEKSNPVFFQNVIILPKITVEYFEGPERPVQKEEPKIMFNFNGPV